MSQTPRPTRSEQRELARAKARDLREKRAKGDKRKRLIVASSVTLGIVAVVAGVIWVIFTFSATENTNKDNAGKVPANVTEFGGVLIGKDLLPATEAQAKASNRIVIYQDYQCPICKLFEEPNTTQIRTWVNSGLATIEYHSISFLDGASLNGYSSRAANAAFCVANSQPEKYFDANTLLYATQPDENTAGPSDSDLKDTLKAAGVEITSEISECVDQKRYGKYIEKKTNEALSQPAVTGTEIPSGTPYVLVNGQKYDGGGSLANLSNPGLFAQFFTTHQNK